MKKTLIILFVALVLSISVNAADKIETITFAWDDTNAAGMVKNFEMYWSESAGGPYTKMAVIPYIAAPHEAPIEATVSGAPGTTETRYFVLTACGDVAVEGGGTEYLCAGNAAGETAFSNEVPYDFWIAAAGFSVPIQFRIVPAQ